MPQCPGPGCPPLHPRTDPPSSGQAAHLLTAVAGAVCLAQPPPPRQAPMARLRPWPRRRPAVPCCLGAALQLLLSWGCGCCPALSSCLLQAPNYAGASWNPRAQLWRGALLCCVGDSLCQGAGSGEGCSAGVKGCKTSLGSPVPLRRAMQAGSQAGQHLLAGKTMKKQSSAGHSERLCVSCQCNPSNAQKHKCYELCMGR